MDFATLCGICSGAMAIAGFVGLWVKIGVTKGRQDELFKAIERAQDRHDVEIKNLQKEQSEISVQLARFMGRLEADIKYIRESLEEVKRDRYAEKKSD